MSTTPVDSLRDVRILVLLARPAWPIDDGWKMRCANIIRGLIDRGAVVDILTFGEADAQAARETVGAFRRLEGVPRDTAYAPSDLVRGVLSTTPFSVINYTSSAYRERLQRWSSDTAYDVLLVEDVVLAQYRDAVSAPVQLLDMHNIESHLMARFAENTGNPAKRWYAGMTAKKLARYEAAVSMQFGRVFVCSADDRERLRQLASSANIDVVPNGIDVDAFAPDSSVASDGSIVFVGTMDYHANVTGAVHFVREILPLIQRSQPNVHLYIVGKAPTEEVRALASDFVHVTGGVPDVRPYVHRAAVSVVPLLVGGGTRLKILESMAMGKAIVSTTIGCEGIDARDGDTIRFADTPEQFARTVVELLASPEARVGLGTRARAFVEANYRWSAILSRVAEAIASRSVRRP